MGLRYGERGISEAMSPPSPLGGALWHPLDIQAGLLEVAGVVGGQGLPTTQGGGGWGGSGSSSPRLLTAHNNPIFSAPSHPRIARAPPECGQPCPHPPPPVLAVGQASGGCSVPRGRPIARLGGAAPTPSRRGPGEAGSAGPSCGPSGRGSAEPPGLGRAAESVREQGALPGRWPGSPVREAVRRPPPAPAAGCDRPGEPAAAFCSAGPARSAAARPGRAGPPRPAGVLAAVIPLPPPHPPSSRGSSHDPPNGASGAPIPYPFSLPAQADEPVGACGEAQVLGSPAPGRSPSSPSGRAKLRGGIPPPVPEGLRGEGREGGR